MPELSSDMQQVAYVAANVERELRPGGFLSDVARAKVEPLADDATAREVAEIIVPEPAPQPQSGVVLEPRWTLVDEVEAARAVRTANAINSDRILSLAVCLGMRNLINEERIPEDVAWIDPMQAFFVVEGGGNKTSVVRRGVAIVAMHQLFGDKLSNHDLYQIGSGRIIPSVRNDRPNPEHKIIRELAGEFLPEAAFTEFDGNLATALADGYELVDIADVHDDELVSRQLTLEHVDTEHPRLTLVKPTGPRLEEALDALRHSVEGKQLVIATNGQYRPKDVYQAELWARDRGVDMMSVVTLGDEPGDAFAFKDGEIVVPNRPEAAYINDMVVLWRLANKRLPIGNSS